MPEHSASIEDFITDGSLIRLCEVLARLMRTPVTLLGRGGEAIIGLENGEVITAPPERTVGDATQAAANAVVVTAPPAFEAEIRVDGRTIGRIALGPTTSTSDDGRRLLLERLVELIASTVGEVCQRESDQRRRAEEMAALHRLSSLLVGVGETGAMLEAGLRAGAEALDADAGIVRLIDDASGALAPRVHYRRPGAPEWRPQFDPEADRSCLDGRIVDGLVPQEPGEHASSPTSALSAGLIFRGRAMGVLSVCAPRERTFSPVERGLFESIASHLAAAVANARLSEAEAESRRVAAQLKVASDVQRRMLPRQIPVIPTLDLAARYTPCSELGGDFYDFFELGGHVGLLVGDVVGKGVPAALLMAHVRAALRAHARHVYDLDEIIARTNQDLCRDTLTNEFATLFYGVIDPRTLRLTYCNAGHEPPIVVHRPGDDPAPSMANLFELSTGGMVLGVDPAQRYQRGLFDLKPGDVMLAYTDGLTDAMNFEWKKFGGKRVRQALLEILQAEPHATAKRIAQHVHWQMRNFAGVNTRTDDTTIVVLRVREQPLK